MATLRQLIEARIKSEVDGLRAVAGAADMQSVLQGRVSPPAAYVFRLRNAAGPNTLANAVDQRVNEQYAVVVVTRNVGDSRGGDSSDANEAICDDIGDALLGWEPAADAEPMEYGGGRLVSLQDQFLFWQETYTTARYRRAV